MNLPGLSRPMRAGGFALLGVSAIALVIGTASAVTGDGNGADDTAEPPRTTESSPQAGDGGEVTPPEAESPDATTTTAAETTTTTTSSEDPASETSGQAGDPGNGGSPAPGPGQTAGPAPGPGSGEGKMGDSVKSVQVRVYNNSTVKGLAKRAGDDLRAQGWNVVATSNYSGGRIPTTTAYYRPGTKEKAAAEAIGREFGMRVEERFDGIKDSSAGVIVIVTNDYRGAS